MKKPIKGAKLLDLVKTAALMVCGLLLILFPSTSAQTLSIIVGAICTALGVLHIILFFLPTKQNRFAQGVVLLCAGLFLFMRPLLVDTLQPYLLAFVVLAAGSDLAQRGLLNRREGKSVGVREQLIAGVIVFVYGAVLMAAPFPELPLHYLFIGIGYLAAGIAFVVTWILCKRKEKPAAQPSAQA